MNNSNSLSLIQGPSTVTCTIATYPHNFPMDFISSLSFRMLQMRTEELERRNTQKGRIYSSKGTLELAV
jgi:hypothetical protein